jgi:poly-gamma-glutamate synthesis protein (capsule biosynthesis protein)
MRAETLTLFLAGDVMIGRGVDQVLPSPCEPSLREAFVRDAREYVALAERVSGPIARPASLAHVWGEALAEFERARPDARIVNLETSVTRSGAFWPEKAVNYRVSPENAACLRVAALDACVLANNHVLDFGREGLLDTLATLDALSIGHAGAGRDSREAEAPAVIDRGARGRVLLFALASPSAGVPREWAATETDPGVWLLPELSRREALQLGRAIAPHVRARDIVVVSLHWGPNWGFELGADERAFAHALIDEAGVHIVHGHSSHHARGLELYRGRLILYGCGDLITDYEGLRSDPRFRGELGLLYFARVEVGTGALRGLELVPMRMRGLRLVRANEPDARWLRGVIARESLGIAAVELDERGRIEVR